jgi:hypothetical protein
MITIGFDPSDDESEPGFCDGCGQFQEQIAFFSATAQLVGLCEPCCRLLVLAHETRNSDRAASRA